MAVLSIVIPLHNEEESLPVLYQRLKGVLNSPELKDHEVILIDDGSRDKTWAIVEDLVRQDSKIKGIKFSRNFGQQSALTAGLDHASGDAVIMMDGDLQHPPELIPQLVAKWKEGFDIVYTKREHNKEYGPLKNLSSKTFAFVFNRVCQVAVEEGVLDFRIISREVAESLKAMKERCRFFRGLVSWVGYKSTCIAYTAPSRISGKTKYSLGKSISLALTGILSFSSRPLYLAGFLGLIATFLSLCYIVYAVYVKLFTDFTVPGWTSILISVLFLGGIQLITIGILGSYLAMVYEEVKARPAYIIQKTAGESRSQRGIKIA
ncbi:MAG: glycosyltransferase family 2 protein [Candidatus Omnitrophota bacterium]